MTGFLLVCNSHLSLVWYDPDVPYNLTLFGKNAKVCKSGIETVSAITLWRSEIKRRVTPHKRALVMFFSTICHTCRLTSGKGGRRRRFYTPFCKIDHVISVWIEGVRWFGGSCVGEEITLKVCFQSRGHWRNEKVEKDSFLAVYDFFWSRCRRGR